MPIEMFHSSDFTIPTESREGKGRESKIISFSAISARLSVPGGMRRGCMT